MCLIVFSYRQHPDYRLVLAANRDEFLDRPTAPLDYHFPGEAILAGRDLRGGGTWLGITTDGRLAAITNYRDPARVRSSVPSRGEIILEYLRSKQSAAEFIEGFAAEAGVYNGFNLLLADRDTLMHFSNISGRSTTLDPGIYGISNHLLNTPWPKVQQARNSLRYVLAENDTPDREAIFNFLANAERPDDSLLPETGIGLEWERLLSPIFIHSPTYGTRSSALITMSVDGQAEFHERSYLHDNGIHPSGERNFQLSLI